MTITERVKTPTPRFFKKLRNAGMLLAAVSASLFAAPVALPVILLKVAGYLAVAGTVAATVSQAVTSDIDSTDAKNHESKDHGEH